MSYPHDFGEALRQILAEQGRSGAWLAKQLYFDPETVNRWMRNGTRPQSPDVIDEIADILGLDATTHEHLLIGARFSAATRRDRLKVSELPYEEFAKQLSEILRIRGDPLGAKLAEKLDLNLRAVNSWLNGKSRPAPEVVDTIARTLKLTEVEWESLFFAAGYKVDVAEGAYRKNTESETTEAADISSRSQDSNQHFIDKFFHLLTQHPNRGAEVVFQSNGSIRIVIGAVTISLVIVLLMSLLAPGTIETLRGIFERTFTTEPTSTATSQPDAAIVVLTTSPTYTVTSTATELAATTELSLTATVAEQPTIASTTTPTSPVFSATLTATMGESNRTETPVATESLALVPTQTPAPASESRCEAKVVSPEGNWPLWIDFRNVPDGVSTSNQNPEFQPGDRVIIQDVSHDDRWYQIKTLSDRILGWADPKFFLTDCVQASQ